MPRPPNGRICRSCAPRFRYSENDLIGSAGRGEHPKGALPLLLLRLDESAQHGVDASLIPAPTLLEPSENVAVEPQRHGLLALWPDDARITPVLVSPERLLWILGDFPLDTFARHRADALPAAFPLYLAGLTQRFPVNPPFPLLPCPASAG